MELGHVDRGQLVADLLRRITSQRHQPREQRNVVAGRYPRSPVQSRNEVRYRRATTDQQQTVQPVCTTAT